MALQFSPMTVYCLGCLGQKKKKESALLYYHDFLLTISVGLILYHLIIILIDFFRISHVGLLLLHHQKPLPLLPLILPMLQMYNIFLFNDNCYIGIYMADLLGLANLPAVLSLLKKKKLLPLSATMNCL